jgi:serine/threonine-protein kinase
MAPAGDGSRREPLTQQGMVYGTPEYMAPEQALGEEVDARADLYSVGVLVFEMITGRRPFDAPNKVQILGMVVSKPVPSFRETLPQSTASADLEAFTRKLLAKTPGGRFADAKAALEALEAVRLDQPPKGDSMVPPASAPLRPSAVDSATAASSRGMLFAAAGGLALAGVIVLVLLGRRDEPTAPPAPGKLVASAPAVATAAVKTVATDEEIAAAVELDAAEALAKRYPGDVKTVANVARAAFASKQLARGVQEVDAAAAKDPSIGSRPGIRAGLREAARSPASDETFVLLASPKLGADGPDVLYDLASSKDSSAEVQKRAEGLLAEQSVRDRASPALRVALDLRATARLATKPACEARNKLLPVAKERGDSRAVPFVKPLTVASCGYFHNKSCHPCLARADLPGTLAALDSRPWE